jgi:methylmalonyl-CoA carboxyltransferase 5S subunit
VAKAAANGMDVFRVFDALNDARNVKRAIAAVKKVGKHAQGTICYTVSPLHTVEGYVRMAKDLMNLGCAGETWARIECTRGLRRKLR